jgi:arginine repressor
MAAKKEEIKKVLRRDLRTGARVTEQQLNEAAEQVGNLKAIDASTLEKIASHIVGDDTAFICASTDLGDINNILKRDKD